MLVDLEFRKDQFPWGKNDIQLISFDDNDGHLITIIDYGPNIGQNGRFENLVAYRLQKGVYETDLNFEHNIEWYTTYEADPYDRRSGADYGIADNVEQILRHHPEVLTSSNPLVISVTPMRKSEQSEDGGWRWHKWGEYIGDQQPTTEYLYDEPIIEEVLVYHIYPLTPKASGE